jgi:T4 RnlA family RNA ligase
MKDLNQLIEQGYITRQSHPTADLHIYNYTNKCQYEREWNETTLACRGLILNSAGEVIQRPFGKFFNASEVEWNLPNEPFKVFEKYDGSLAILYWINDTPFIASRGSFCSPQSVKATELLHTKYKDTWGNLNKENCYVFEVLYPENRIVVGYGDKEELILLSVRRNSDGKELPLEDVGFPIAKQYEGFSLEALKNIKDDENSEGFVLLFESGLRVKIKNNEYQRLHRLVTGVSNLVIWELMRDGKQIEELLDRVPDEFFKFCINTYNDLIVEFDKIEFACKLDFKLRPEGDRKAIAEFFKSRPYPGVLFAMLDDKNYKHIIWMMLRPKLTKPFSHEYQDKQRAS